jgi:hypothetical protein
LRPPHECVSPSSSTSLRPEQRLRVVALSGNILLYLHCSCRIWALQAAYWFQTTRIIGFNFRSQATSSFLTLITYNKENGKV